ncbi:uncharacterized protein LOC121101165 [Ursus maritimus]|uniref:Uncharacterized protein LOC121101165 n=1 Tax=Ursus maritimus TaxID=29073 RepID=A0A8M1F8C6_URSMA|nr:uncharacterized protein LOC121101165 [Ursus maritimus]
MAEANPILLSAWWAGKRGQDSCPYAPLSRYLQGQDLGSGSPFSGSISPSGSDIEKCYSGSCLSPRRVCVCRSESQPVLTQLPSLSASLGSSPRLTPGCAPVCTSTNNSQTLACTLSSGFRVGGSSIYWFQQLPGSPPRYLLDYSSDSDKHQDSGVPSRFSGSKDTSANAGLLLISGLQPEDEADCFWATAHGRGSSSHSSQCLRRGRSGSETSGPKNLVSEPLSRRHYMDRHSRVVASA